MQAVASTVLALVLLAWKLEMNWLEWPALAAAVLVARRAAPPLFVMAQRGLWMRTRVRHG